jgi:hypothetical protein
MTSIRVGAEDFVPDEKISIDIEHTLDQTTSKFQTVRDGLPELVKNSKDHYLRLNIMEREDRQIVVIISPDKTHLGVLDFGGARLEDFDGWKKWASRTSGRNELSSEIEAGYGNGGKSFMVRGCLNDSSMCGYYEGKVNKFGFNNENKKLKYLSGVYKYMGHQLKNFPEGDYKEVLNRELKPFRITLENLPEPSKVVLNKRKSFTIVKLNGIKDWNVKGEVLKIRAISQITQNLLDHAQASMTIEMCTVWVQEGKKLLVSEPLRVLDFEPFKDLKEIPKIYIPDYLEDSELGDKVYTGNFPKEEKYLLIKTSSKDLRSFGINKARNVIRVKNGRNTVSSWSVSDLAPLNGSAYLYGEINCPEISSEYTSGADRGTLVDRPLIRALKHWTSEQVKEIAKKIQSIITSRDYDDDKEEVSDTLEKLRKLMEEYLKAELEGAKGNTPGGEKDDEGIVKPPLVSWGNRIDKISLEEGVDTLRIAFGTTIPLVVKCYEKKAGKELPVKSKGLIEVCSDSKKVTDILEISGNSAIKGLSTGKVKIFYQTLDGKVKSNELMIEVVGVNKLSIEKPSIILKQGEKIKLRILPYTDEKVIEGLLFESYVDEQEMGKISRSGIFTAGGIAGSATVRIKYGSENDQFTKCLVDIGNEKIKKSSGSKGLSIPLILICGMEAPGLDDWQEGTRTHFGGGDYPTIIDCEPVWERENIVWINDKSKESQKVKSSRGARCTMSIFTKTFHEFIAMKCFEILKRLVVRQKMGDDTYTHNQVFEMLGNAEMNTSKFIEEAYILVDKIIEERGSELEG